VNHDEDEKRFGRYRLLGHLAQGGMAEIFVAQQEGPAGVTRELVLKRILPQFSAIPHFVEMFLDEARIAAQLAHPNIVSIYDFGEVDGDYFLAMELVHGPNLRELRRAAWQSGLRVPCEVAAKLCAGVAEGLAYAHRLSQPDGTPLRIVHRDVSPANIVVSYDGVPKVLDFGIAKASSSTHQTEQGVLKGKVAYMAPEQVAGDAIDHRVDLYALGVVLYQLVTNRLPFAAGSALELMSQIKSERPIPPSAHVAALPAELERIILRALETDRARRYQDAQALCTDLERFVLSRAAPLSSFDVAEYLRQVERRCGRPLDAVSLIGSTKDHTQPAKASASADTTPLAPPMAGQEKRAGGAVLPRGAVRFGSLALGTLLGLGLAALVTLVLTSSEEDDTAPRTTTPGLTRPGPGRSHPAPKCPMPRVPRALQQMEAWSKSGATLV